MFAIQVLPEHPLSTRKLVNEIGYCLLDNPIYPATTPSTFNHYALLGQEDIGLTGIHSLFPQVGLLFQFVLVHVQIEFQSLFDSGDTLGRTRTRMKQRILVVELNGWKMFNVKGLAELAIGTVFHRGKGCLGAIQSPLTIPLESESLTELAPRSMEEYHFNGRSGSVVKQVAHEQLHPIGM